jgi:hypothetical protein
MVWCYQLLPSFAYQLVKGTCIYPCTPQFAESQPCYSAQEIMQLHILHSNFLQKQKECTKQADIHQMFKKACKSHMDSPVISKGVEVRKPGGMEAGVPTASMVDVLVSDGDL